MEIAKEKNTISNTLVQAKEMRGGSRVAFDRLNEDSVILDNSVVLPSENSAIMQRPIVSQGETSSFSYLPSIHGVFRGKLASGASADVGSPMGYKRRRYGAS